MLGTARRDDLASIHSKGATAVDAFMALYVPSVASCKAGPRAGRRAAVEPDCSVTYASGVSVPVEVKKTTTSTSQLRPLDYRVTVVWRDPDEWWVLPPQDVLELALKHAGQHCISSLECFNPGKPNDGWSKWSCTASQVPARVTAAHASGEKHALKSEVEKLRAGIHRLYDEQKEVVAKLLD